MVKNLTKKTQMNQMKLLLTVHDPTRFCYSRIRLHSSVDWNPNNRTFLGQIQLWFIMLHLADKSKLISKLLLHILFLRF